VLDGAVLAGFVELKCATMLSDARVYAPYGGAV
jgi:hypothetical protein